MHGQKELNNKRKSQPVKKPRAGIVCDESDGHVVIFRLTAKGYRVPPHGVYKVVRAITRYTNNVKRVLGTIVECEVDATTCRKNTPHADEGDALTQGFVSL